ncbi:MAG TPA: hypothetical protein VJ792_03985 [Candidatus Nitrosotalea sp.]|nr:hypothetical protein [Candidatus Nitrosotalea sp.]
MNIDKAIYVEGEYVKVKADYEASNPKQTLHIVVFDPSEREVFSTDQYLNSQKGSYSMVLKFDTRQWRNPGRYKITSWDQDGTRKEIFFQFKAKTS